MKVTPHNWLATAILPLFFLFSNQAQAGCADFDVIDVGFIYDKTSDDLGPIQGTIDEFLHAANQFYANSNVCITLRDVGKLEVPVPYNNDDEEKTVMIDDQELFQGYINVGRVAKFRREAGADILAHLTLANLVDKNGTNLIGRATLGPRPGAYFQITNIRAGVKVFAHEIGHIFGLYHALRIREEVNAPFVPYAVGYGVQSQFATIMTDSPPLDYGVSSRIDSFSNPAIKINGIPTGIPGVADSARALNKSKDLVSQYMPTKTALLESKDSLSFRIRGDATNKCIDVAGFNKNSGANIQHWDCTNNANQFWRVDFVPEDGNYIIRSELSGLCLMASGGNIVQKNCGNFAANSRWILNPRRFSNRYSIESVSQPGFFISHYSNKNNGANIVLRKGFVYSVETTAQGSDTFIFEALPNYKFRSTPPNDMGGTNSFFLDRHTIECLHQGINQFRLGRPAARQINYQYQCTNADPAISPVYRTGIKYSGGGFGNARFLDRHNIECNNRAIKAFGLRRASHNSWYYDYTCGTQPVQNEVTRHTGWNDLNWVGSNIYLDRHDVRCGHNEVLTRVQLQSKVVGFWWWEKRPVIRYEYQCGSFAANVASPTLTKPQNASIISNKFLQWSHSGPIANLSCTQWLEPADPHSWNNNYLCAKSDIGMQWSNAGPIAGMRCTQIIEASDPHSWQDNYLCVPKASPYTFEWESSLKSTTTYNECVQIQEPAEPSAHTWHDNFLCYKAPLIYQLYKNLNEQEFTRELVRMINTNEGWKIRQGLVNLLGGDTTPAQSKDVLKIIILMMKARQLDYLSPDEQDKLFNFGHAMATYARRAVSTAQSQSEDFFAPELVREFLDLLESSGKPDSINNAQSLRATYELENCSVGIFISMFGNYPIIGNKKGLIVDEDNKTCFF